jgi:hypothetical protein
VPAIGRKQRDDFVRSAGTLGIAEALRQADMVADAKAMRLTRLSLCNFNNHDISKCSEGGPLGARRPAKTLKSALG